MTANVTQQGTAKFGARVTGVAFDLAGALQISRELGDLASRLPWLQERAIRTLNRRLPVEARRDIQAEYNITAARVREHLVSRTISAGTRLAGIRLIGQWKRGIGLLNYGARQTRKGVTYSVYQGSRKLEAHAFIARMLGGNLHAVQRYGPKVEMKAGRYQGKKRQRVEVLYRSTVAQMLAKGRRPERLLDYSRRVLQADVERQLQSYLRNPSSLDSTTT
jgi:hypothetical protein